MKKCILVKKEKEKVKEMQEESDHQEKAQAANKTLVDEMDKL